MGIHIGVAGWDYADWAGIVYPAGGGRGLDRLAWIGRFVDVVEINSSFYRPVEPRVARSWIRRTREMERFRFTAKAHRSWTHEGDTDPATVVALTLAGLQPLREAGKLGALLVQYPQSFHFNEGSTGRIEALVARAPDWPLVVEVRHRSWAGAEAAEWFARNEIGWCLVDQPAAGPATLGPLPRVTSPVAYLRMHGRNVADWFRPDAGRDDRYDYLYAPDELESIATAVREMSATAEETFVIQNNHFRGQALVNSLQLSHLVTGRRRQAPQELVDSYPQLTSAVTVQRTRLF